MNKENEKKNETVLDYSNLSTISEEAGQKIDDVIRRATANQHLVDGDASINNIGRQYANASKAQLAGRVAEAQQAATFNADAATRGLNDITSVTSAAKGLNKDASDIFIFEKGEMIEKVQVKFCGTADNTAKQLSQPKYNGMQKVAPADQIRTARRVASRLSLKNAGARPEMSKQYRDTADRVADHIEFKKASSSPLTRHEAKNLAKQASKGKACLPKPEQGSLLGEIGNASGAAALSGAKVAGITTLALSGAGNAKAWYDGKISATEAVIDTTCAAATSALDGAAKAAVGTAIKCGAEAVAKTAGKEIAKSVAKESLKSGVARLASSNAAFAVGTVAVDAAVGVAQLCTGKISTGDCARKVGNSAAVAGGAMACGQAGAALGTMLCPGIGTFAGGVLGGIIGSVGGSSIFSGIFD
ncbi:MAG TPA: hypothetical protein PLM07_12395 [Candidatus Rifleibacterium sp.]|nr:hypothetical protein [Candidatus Rifleibacterium sp.]